MKMNIDLIKFFSKEELNQLARESGFVTRTSKISGFTFLLTFTTGLVNTPGATLAQLASFLNNVSNTEISPQAIDERISEKALTFLRICFLKALKLSTSTIRIPNELISTFKHIYITDSTNFDLHPSLKDRFKGNSGGASPSSMRIQYVYDYLTDNMLVEIGDVRTTDQKTLNSIVKDNKVDTDGNTLFIQDLGYFDTSTFAHIDNCLKNKFISKLKYRVNLASPNGQPIDLIEILKGEPDEINLPVIIGELKCRLVGGKLPEKIVNERLRKANKNALKNRIKVTKDYKIFASYALYLTNLPEEYTAKIIFTIYRLRWQIELIFKIWKSILMVHKIHSERESRVLCEIYGKLIVAVLISRFTNYINANCTKFVSYFRALQYTKAIMFNMAISIIKGSSSLLKFLNNLYSQVTRFCMKNHQKNKPTIENLLFGLGSAPMAKLNENTR